MSGLDCRWGRRFGLRLSWCFCLWRCLWWRWKPEAATHAHRTCTTSSKIAKAAKDLHNTQTCISHTSSIPTFFSCAWIFAGVMEFSRDQRRFKIGGNFPESTPKLEKTCTRLLPPQSRFSSRRRSSIRFPINPQAFNNYPSQKQKKASKSKTN